MTLILDATYFFLPPLNTAPAVLVDNRYDTSSMETSLIVYIDANGDGTGHARSFSHIFFKAKGTIPASYTVRPEGGDPFSVETVNLPVSVTDSSDETRSLTVKGFYHHFSSEWKYGDRSALAKSLRFTFQGGLDIVQLYVLQSVVEIEQGGFTDFRWVQRLAGIEQESARGRGSVAPPVAGNRAKYDLHVTAHKNTADDISRALDAFFLANPEFVFATEPKRYPEQVFKAKNKGQTAEYSYISQYKGRGRRTQFVISEL